MRIRNLLILGMVLVGFSYCSSDDVLDGPATGNEKAENLKMEITIQMPTGATTRTNTGDVTYKAGEANENMPNRVIVALYDMDEEFVASYDSKNNSPTTGATFITTAEFKVNDLKVEKQYYVYAFVNPHSDTSTDSYIKDLNSVFSSGITLDEAIAAVTKVGGVTTGAQENFFMSNSEKVLTEPIQASHIQGAPLKVGVNVQRAVARMDFTGTTTTFDLDGAKVVLTHFKPMNASKSFYNLKHVVAADKAIAAPADLTAAIGVAENNGNYVVDTDWQDKVDNARTADHWNSKFHSYMGATTTTTKEDYAAFQEKYTALNANFYTTENTLPADADKIFNNTKGIATAVVFKGHLLFTGSETETRPVYVWNNKFYGTFDKLPAGIQAIGNENTANLASAGVTGYSKVGDEYPIYYVYYNVHNQLDTPAPGVVGPMEFGVVRNNIYQLSIKSLSKFGHPNDPELNPTEPSVDDNENPIVVNPDPSPQDPQDPIKSSELYMQVTATVLNWTVRTNEIEF